MQAPEEVQRDGVETVHASFAHDVAPRLLGGEAPVVQFPEPDRQPGAVDGERVLVPSDFVGFSVVAREDIRRR